MRLLPEDYDWENLLHANYADDLALLTNISAQAESLLHSLEQAAGGIGLFVKANKTEFMCFKQKKTITTLIGKLLKLIDLFICLNSWYLSNILLANV